MRRRLLVLINMFWVLAACTTPQVQVQTASSPQFRPTATIKDLMDSVIDPNADFIWESVAITVSAKGVEERVPRNDEEWKDVRRHTVALLEGTNLLLIPERHVAQPGEKSENPDIELSPDQIEVLIDKDRAAWAAHVKELYDSIIPSLQAIEAKDKEKLLNTSGDIDRACESCHLKYWYPNDAEAQKAFAESQKQQ